MMPKYTERHYRKRTRTRDLGSFQVGVKETDLWVSAERELSRETRDLIVRYRRQLEGYIESHPLFWTSLQPMPEDPYASPMIAEMIRVTKRIGVGPMAAVAGALAQYVGKGLLTCSDQVIVENGGDIFLHAKRAVTISVFAGDSPLSERIGLKIPLRQMPLGVCSSSGRVGHSLSKGVADAVCVLSSSALLADGAATYLGNRIKRASDLRAFGDWVQEIDGLLGGLAIVGDKMAVWGDIELVSL
jgi:ApbE superfamily uncharacterized protein (UPF0280 family)